MKFYLHDSAARKTSESFGKIKESIILKIQKSFEEHIFLTESIISRTKKVFNKPSRGKSTLAATAANADERALENETFLEEYRIDYAIFRKEEKKYKEAWVKAYALIWDSYCSREVQTAIKEMSTFETKIKDEQIALLEMIEMLMHTPEKAKYPSLTLIEVLLSFTKIKQGENEELIDYLSRFKTERDIMSRLPGQGLEKIKKKRKK